MMESKILIVDGSNLLFQMFFGMPARIYNNDGIGIWGVLGFIGALLKIIRQIAPTHMVVLFDGENDNERLAIDKNYKATALITANSPQKKIPIPSFLTFKGPCGIWESRMPRRPTVKWTIG